MEGPLNKSQLCWVLIRFLGIFLIFQALTSFVVMFWTKVLLSNQMESSFPGASLGRNSFDFLTLILSTAIPAGIGLYLLYSGRAIHRCLMTEPQSIFNAIAASSYPEKKPLDPDDEVDPETTLTRAETNLFFAWLKDHPEFQNRFQPDQIALFRDFQKDGETGA